MANHLAELAYAIITARRNRQDPQKVCEVLSRGLAGSVVMQRKADMMIKKNFDPPQFRASLHLKDLRNAAHTQLKQHGEMEPYTRIALERFERLYKLGYGNLDHAALSITLSLRKNQ